MSIFPQYKINADTACFRLTLLNETNKAVKLDIDVYHLKERFCDHLRFEMQSKMHLRLECKLKVSV